MPAKRLLVLLLSAFVFLLILAGLLLIFSRLKGEQQDGHS